MKNVILALIFLVLIGCTNNERNSSSINESVNTSQVDSDRTLNEEEALNLVNSKLNQEELRVSSIRVVGTDENGNYIVSQSSKATTVVIEWYHVNPITEEISCEILGGNCLDDNTPVIPEEELSIEQEKALVLAKSFAKDHLVQYGYNDDLTYVEFSHMDNENLVFQVYNPGSGGTYTIDWLTVNLDQGTVISKFKLDAPVGL